MNTARLMVVLACVMGVGAVRAVETREGAGTVTNTTHEVAAPMRMMLEIDGGVVTGWLVTEAPLQAGRWPLKGVRKGAWCEVRCEQAPGTTTVFRGVLGSSDYRGTYVFSGESVLAQYGRFHVKIAPIRR